MYPQEVDLRTNQDAEPGAEGRRQFLWVKNGCKQPRGPAGYGEQHGRNRMTSKARNDFAPAGELYSESWENTRERQGHSYKREP